MSRMSREMAAALLLMVLALGQAQQFTLSPYPKQFRTDEPNRAMSNFTEAGCVALCQSEANCEAAMFEFQDGWCFRYDSASTPAVVVADRDGYVLYNLETVTTTTTTTTTTTPPPTTTTTSPNGGGGGGGDGGGGGGGGLGLGELGLEQILMIVGGVLGGLLFLLLLGCAVWWCVRGCWCCEPAPATVKRVVPVRRQVRPPSVMWLN